MTSFLPEEVVLLHSPPVPGGVILRGRGGLGGGERGLGGWGVVVVLVVLDTRPSPGAFLVRGSRPGTETGVLGRLLSSRPPQEDWPPRGPRAPTSLTYPHFELSDGFYARFCLFLFLFLLLLLFCFYSLTIWIPFLEIIPSSSSFLSFFRLNIVAETLIAPFQWDWPPWCRALPHRPSLWGSALGTEEFAPGAVQRMLTSLLQLQELSCSWRCWEGDFSLTPPCQPSSPGSLPTLDFASEWEED